MQRSVIAKLRFLAIAGALVESAPAHAGPVAAQRCSIDALTPAVARLRLEWARSCGTRINIVSPTNPVPPASKIDLGVLGDGVTHVIEYIETDDFFGRNSYSGPTAQINQSFIQNQWRPGPITTATDVNGFQKWLEAATLALSRPIYPTFGTSSDINTAVPLYPSPNYALGDCGFFLDPAGTQRANTSVTGFYVNAYCVPEPVTGRCADGSIEQTFPSGMVGCAGTATYANRAAVCGPSSRVATAAEWVALRSGVAPTHNYWTEDPLKFNGTGSSSCFVSTSVGSDCGTTPMRVCAGTDPEGNVCNWTHCGIDAITPDQFFGGCAGNPSAGAACVPNVGCADGSAEQVFGQGMVGCAGSVTFADRNTLCAPGYKAATAAQWVTGRGTAAPTHNYWTDDALNWAGTGPSACSVSTTTGSNSCGASPMRVCGAATDAENNICIWTHCGLNTNTPDQFFGGCASNAGTLCTPAL
jgi:hypothetical protein